MTKLRNIEFLRIIFCMAIVYLHIFNCQMSNFIQNTHDNNIIDLFNKMAFNCSNGWLLVQGFVMIAGFFLFYSIKKKGNMPWGKFALDKLVRLYSVMAFYTLLCVLLVTLQTQKAL